ncbi:hypothetical protein MIND_00033700 [Mycena indigotica]|uniref:Uncharacterized protein n=1 Tax=Mycena indigotica TaxID=2126181 RepID=A0A8H6TAZ9_9AGAR|nr:uncharacterized protein MIND_00033700 [Mycena indigotica]KAF7315193.1 hypothetical protein MIND_00033700 [Mycena indigotica]
MALRIKKIPFPALGSFAVFTMDPVLSLDPELRDDPEAVKACKQLKVGRYVGLVNQRSGLYNPWTPYNACQFYFLLQGLPEAQPYGFDASMSIPVAPMTIENHPSGRAPLQPSKPLPWKDCYLSGAWHHELRSQSVYEPKEWIHKIGYILPVEDVGKQRFYTLMDDMRSDKMRDMVIEPYEGPDLDIDEEPLADPLSDTAEIWVPSCESMFPDHGLSVSMITGTFSQDLSTVKELAHPSSFYDEVKALSRIMDQARHHATATTQRKDSDNMPADSEIGFVSTRDSRLSQSAPTLFNVTLMDVPTKRIPFPAVGAFAVFTMDPILSLDPDLRNNPEAIEACAQLKVGNYVGLVNDRSGLFNPLAPYNACFFDFLLHGSPTTQPHGFDPSMSIPIAPMSLENHPSGRAPLQPSKPLPWKDCYLSGAWTHKLRSKTMYEPEEQTEKMGHLLSIKDQAKQKFYITKDEERSTRVPNVPVVVAEDIDEEHCADDSSEDSGEIWLPSFETVFPDHSLSVSMITSSFSQDLSTVKELAHPSGFYQELEALSRFATFFSFSFLG